MNLFSKAAYEGLKGMQEPSEPDDEHTGVWFDLLIALSQGLGAAC